MDAMIEQFVRANEIRPGWFRQFQRYLVDNVQVRLDRLEELEPEGRESYATVVAERDALRVENETMKADLEKARDGRGRQRAGAPA